jgi:hypothetical protein
MAEQFMLISGQRAEKRDFDGILGRLQAAPDPFGQNPAASLFAAAPVLTETNRSLLSGFEAAAGQAALATMVEQAQVGYSARAPIGTENVADCIGLIVRDPLSGKTALAHIDRYGTPESLPAIFERMPKGRMLEAVLWGAKYGRQPDAEPQMAAWSEHNLRKVVALLTEENVNVIGAKIYDRTMPSAVTVDPATGLIRGENPEQGEPSQIAFHADPDRDLSAAKMILNYSTGQGHRLDSIALDTGFDLTSAPGRMPLRLRREDVAILNEQVAGKTPAQIEEWAQAHYPGEMAPYVARMLPLWNNAYEKALAPVTASAMRAMDALEIKGADFAQDEREHVMGALRQLPLYAGENADHGNRRLTDFIQNGLFKNGRDGGVHIDLDGLAAAGTALPAVTVSAAPAGRDALAARP